MKNSSGRRVDVVAARFTAIRLTSAHSVVGRYLAALVTEDTIGVQIVYQPP